VPMMKHAVIRPPRSDRVKVAVADGGDRDKGPPQRVSQGVDVGAGGVPLEQVHDDRAVEDQHRGGQQEPAQVPAPEHRPDQPETEDHAHQRDGDRDEGKRGGTTTSHSVARASRSSGWRVLASYSARRPGSFTARSASAPRPGRWLSSVMVISVPPGSPADQAHQPSRATRPHHAGDGPRPVRAGYGLALGS
jgi:hypothetical protein